MYNIFFNTLFIVITCQQYVTAIVDSWSIPVIFGFINKYFVFVTLKKSMVIIYAVWIPAT